MAGTFDAGSKLGVAAKEVEEAKKAADNARLRRDETRERLAKATEV